MFHELIVHKLCQKFNVYLVSRIGNDNRGRGHSYANRSITAPNKGNLAFTRGLERKTWRNLVIYTIQTITILSWQKSKTLEL